MEIYNSSRQPVPLFQWWIMVLGWKRLSLNNSWNLSCFNFFLLSHALPGHTLHTWLCKNVSRILFSRTDTIVVLRLNTSSRENTVLSCRLLQVVSLVYLIKIIEKLKNNFLSVHCFHSHLSSTLFQPYSPDRKTGEKMGREENLEIKINQKFSEV